MSKMGQWVLTEIQNGNLPAELEYNDYDQNREECSSTPADSDSEPASGSDGGGGLLRRANQGNGPEGGLVAATTGVTVSEGKPADAV